MIKVPDSIIVDKPDYLSPTGIETCSRCPARYLFSKLLRFEKQDMSRIALDYGKCMHCAIPEAYTDVDKAMDVFEAVWAEYDYGDMDKKRNSTRARASFEAFYNLHQPQVCPYELLPPPSGVVEIRDKFNDYESPFLIDIGGSLLFYGKIDRFIIFNNRTWPLDYKTSGEVSPRVFNNLSGGAQALGYTLAGSHLIGERCPGLFLELIRTSPTNAESVPNMSYVKDHWLDIFVEDTKELMDKILEYHLKGEWPQKPSGCAPYGMFGGAGYVCDYKPICDSPDWTEALRFFTQRKWNPLVLTKEEENEDA
jgi:hypothetical protein